MHDYEQHPAQLPRRDAESTGASRTRRERPGPEPGVLRGHADAASLLHLQRTAGNAGVVQLLGEDEARSPVHDVVGNGGGAPLDAGTRTTMEAAFGQDFGDVRVHTDAKASASAESVGANAYTAGRDIVFRSGQFDPGSPTGQRTLAHELTHVVQQRAGPVDGSEAPGGIRLSDPSDSFELAADKTAEAVLSAGTDAASDAATAQREADETAVPMLQRQTETDEEEEVP